MDGLLTDGEWVDSRSNIVLMAGMLKIFEQEALQRFVVVWCDEGGRVGIGTWECLLIKVRSTVR